MENNLFSIKCLSRISTRLVLGTLTSLMLFPVNKALAGYPSANVYVENLSIDYNQCMERAAKAANLVLSSVEEEIYESTNRLILFGYTTVSTTTVMCIKKEQGSTLLIVSSGASWWDIDDEAESVRDRIMEVLSSNL